MDNTTARALGVHQSDLLVTHCVKREKTDTSKFVIVKEFIYVPYPLHMLIGCKADW
jgi:hypothetical protein